MKSPVHNGRVAIKNAAAFVVCHLWEGEATAPQALAVEYIDAAMAIILQRGSNGQIVEAVDVDIGQHSESGAKPSMFIFFPSQYSRSRVELAVNILTGSQRRELAVASPLSAC